MSFGFSIITDGCGESDIFSITGSDDFLRLLLESMLIVSLDWWLDFFSNIPLGDNPDVFGDNPGTI